VTTIRQLLDELSGQLIAADIENPRKEARLLVQHVTGLEVAQIIGDPDQSLGADDIRRIRDLTTRRSASEPLALITGVKEFWSLPFAVTPDTLIPRPDSESLIEAALEATPGRNQKLRILDLGVGSGCLLLALLSELPRAWGLGVDLNPAAIATAKRNADTLNLEDRVAFSCGNWGDSLSPDENGKFDLVICNPPYVTENEWRELDGNIRLYEPRLALDGGPDGLQAYRSISAQLGLYLAPLGIAIIEMGYGQHVDIKEIFERSGHRVQGMRQDFSKVNRCLLATL
jgi:release factor glutamine methyltransferase